MECSEGERCPFRPSCSHTLFNRRLFLEPRGCATALIIAPRTQKICDGLQNENIQYVTGDVVLELREEGRDGDTDLGITCIMVKVETIGTDKITQKRGKEKREPAGNSHF